MNRLLLPFLALLVTSLGCHVDGGWSVALRDQVERREDRALDLAAGETLSLSSSMGSIEVLATDAATPALQATLRASGRTKEEAQAVLARYSLKLERGPQGITVGLVGEPLQLRSGLTQFDLAAGVDFVATVPLGTRIEAHSGSGALGLRGTTGSLNLDTDYGSIEIESVRGDVLAKSGSGSVKVGSMEGGELRLSSEYGSIRVEAGSARRLECRSGSGDLRLGELEVETLELSTDYGRVHVESAGGAVLAHSGSGDVCVLGAHGAVTARSDYGSVEVEGLLSALDVHSGSGNVHASATPGSQLNSRWSLSSDYGSVCLSVPSDFACLLDARSDYGSVDCDFPVTVEAGRKQADSSLKGTIGKGGETVALVSGSGDVALKRL